MPIRDTDIRAALSTTAPDEYNDAGTGYNLLTNWGPAWPDEPQAKELRNPCGNSEFGLGYETLRSDVSQPISGRVYPKCFGHQVALGLGGGAGYTVSGTTDITHQGRVLKGSQRYYDWFTYMRWFADEDAWFEFRGAQYAALAYSCDQDADEGALNFTGLVVTDGTRTPVDPFTEPTCDTGEFAYRFGDATITFGEFNQTPLDTEDYNPVAYGFSINPALLTRPRRSGLYVAAPREYGNRRAFGATLSVLEAPGGPVDTLYKTEKDVALTVVHANPVADKTITFTALKGHIVNRRPGYSQENNQNTWILDIALVEDPTNSTTKARSPLEMKVINTVTTYRA